MERLLKVRKYFAFLKANRGTFVDGNYSGLKAQSATAFDTVAKVQAQIQQKLEDSFENQDKKAQVTFNIGKLEQIKMQANNDFFKNIDAKKQDRATGGKKSDKNNGLIDLEVGEAEPVRNNANKDLGDDLMDFDVVPVGKQQPAQKKQGDSYGHLDLLDDAPVPKQNNAVKQDTDLLFDFQHNLSVKPQDNKNTGGLLDDDMFGDIGASIRSEVAKNEKDNKAKAQSNDPFDFMAF